MLCLCANCAKKINDYLRTATLKTLIEAIKLSSVK